MHTFICINRYARLVFACCFTISHNTNIVETFRKRTGECLCFCMFIYMLVYRDLHLHPSFNFHLQRSISHRFKPFKGAEHLSFSFCLFDCLTRDGNVGAVGAFPNLNKIQHFDLIRTTGEAFVIFKFSE